MLVEARAFEVASESNAIEDPVLLGDELEVLANLRTAGEIFGPGILLREAELVGDTESVDSDVWVFVQAPGPADLVASLIDVGGDARRVGVELVFE